MKTPTVPLGSLCEVVRGSSPRPKGDPRYFGGTIPWVLISDVTRTQGRWLTKTVQTVTEAGKEQSRYVSPGQLIVSNSATVGLPIFMGVGGCIHDGFLTFLGVDKRLTLEWLYWFFLYSRKHIETLAPEGTQKNLNIEIVENISIPLPDLAKQRQIAAMLEQADRLRCTRRYVLELGDEFLPAVFRQIFGELHETSRWQFHRLEELAAIASGVAKGQKYAGHRTVKVPYLRVANVQDGFLNLSEIKFIDALPDDVEVLRLQPGDIVMTEGGDFDKLGRGAIWHGGIPDCIHQNHIFRVRLDGGKMLPTFFAAFLRSTYAKDYFLSCSKQTTNLASINMTQLKNTPVPVPPLPLQRCFVALVARHERLRARHREALRQADHLFQTLLHRAFADA